MIGFVFVFWYLSGKIFWFSRKNMISPENFIVRPENFCHLLEEMWYVRKKFWYVPRIFLGWKSFRCPFQSKSALEVCPLPQLLDASYATGYRSVVGTLRVTSAKTLYTRMLIFSGHLAAYHLAIYTGCIKKKVIELQRAIIRELLGVWTIGFHIRKDQTFSYWMICFSCQVEKK
jgi:hypothetical protein